MRITSLFLSFLLAVIAIPLFAQPTVAQLDDQAQILINCFPDTGCQFKVSFKHPTKFSAIKWDFGDGKNAFVPGQDVATHFYERAGDYVLQAQIFFDNDKPLLIQKGFTIQPMGDPWQRVIKSAQDFGLQVGAALVGILVVLKMLGVVA